MDSLQTISNDLVQSINEKEKKKSIPYDTYAKVIRIDGGTAWVHIPGGVDETPVALTVNAKAGDSVLVRVSGGNAWIVGNSSAPPTDDTKAVEAKGVADVAQVKAASAQETAENAEEVAKDASRAVKSTSQYFWHTETDTGAGAGAHITEIPQEDFLDDPANGGANLLARSGGIAVRKGKQEVAQFGNTVVLGKDDGSQSYMSLDYHSLQLIDKEGDPYLYASDLRNAAGNYDNTDIFYGDGATERFDLTFKAKNTSYSVTTEPQHSGYFTRTQTQLIFNTAPADGTVITVAYTTNDQLVKAFTLGLRDPGGTVGAMSYAEGYRPIASGKFSHAEGARTTATGTSSHAEGSNTTSSGYKASHAEGGSTTASGSWSHAEGGDTTASGVWAHAEGASTTASGMGSHSEGSNTVASGNYSHAEGVRSEASGIEAHAQNLGTIADQVCQTAVGKYNTEGNTDNLFVVGNGTALNARHDAFQVDKSGNVEASGDITDGSGNVLSDKAEITETTNSIEFGEWKLVWGTVSMNSNSASGSGTFTAPYYNDTTVSLGDDAFTGAPYVWCTLQGSATGTRNFSAHGVSASSFKIRMYSSHKNSTNFTCRWVAIGKK